jgi:hypothetical protein
MDGWELGCFDGCVLGSPVGCVRDEKSENKMVMLNICEKIETALIEDRTCVVGWVDGCVVGCPDGSVVGCIEGWADGRIEGCSEG